MLSQQIFLLLQAQSHANSLVWALTLGDMIRDVNQVNKKIRKNHFFDIFPPIFTTDRLTDPIFQAKMTENEIIIDDRLIDIILIC